MSASELSTFFDRIQALNPRLNAFTDLVPERAAAAPALGSLAGKTFAFKNFYDFAGLTTRAGSIILADNPPATEDSAAVASLISAGAIPLGATNMVEFAFGFTTENSHVGPARNPYDLTRSAGGSSGGVSGCRGCGLGRSGRGRGGCRCGATADDGRDGGAAAAGFGRWCGACAAV